MFYSIPLTEKTYNFIFSPYTDPSIFYYLKDDCIPNLKTRMEDVGAFLKELTGFLNDCTGGEIPEMKKREMFYHLLEDDEMIMLVVSPSKINMQTYMNSTFLELPFYYVGEDAFIEADTELGKKDVGLHRNHHYTFPEIRLMNKIKGDNVKKQDVEICDTEDVDIGEDGSCSVVPKQTCYYMVKEAGKIMDLPLAYGNLYDCGSHFVIETDSVLDDFFEQTTAPVGAKLIGTFPLIKEDSYKAPHKVGN